MILTGAAMKALEERAFVDGIAAEDLMDEAGEKIAEAVGQFFPLPGRCLVFFGKGHNGSDALVAARHLVRRGWQVDLRPAFPENAWADLTGRKHAELLAELALTNPDRSSGGWPIRPLVVLDGLLGIGAGGELREPIRSATQEINRLRTSSPAKIVALDLPTGLDADTGSADADAVIADYTLSIGFAKAGLLTDGATRFVGRLAVLPLEALSTRVSGEYSETVATAAELAPLLKRRSFETHKGECGRIAIVAGSCGLTGAARLASDACVRAGAGLISLFVPEDIYPVLAASVVPEVMVHPVKSYLEVLDFRSDVIAIGPGLGQSHASEIRQILDRAPQPMVVDADALNILSKNLHLLDRCAGPRLLTPHPGEMARLDPQSKDRTRLETVHAFTARWPHTLLLKGARTIIGRRGAPSSYNTTGSPGMATGGMGDVLTGVCAALIGQKLEVYDAARVGAWVCGRAAEIALAEGGESEESLTPTALIDHLGRAFLELRGGCW